MFTSLAIILYVTIIIAITTVASHYNDSLAAFQLGGRKNSGMVTALAAGTSDMSGWLMISLPMLVFNQGIQATWLPISLLIGAYLNWSLVSHRIRTMTEFEYPSTTIPDFFDARFDSSILQTLISTITLIFFCLYTASSFMAGALLCNHFFLIDYQTGLYLFFVLLVFYTMKGGFLAVSWIDLFQGFLMLLALFLMPIIIFSSEPILKPLSYSAFIPNGNLFDLPYKTLFSYLSWGAGYFGQFHIALRFMAVRSQSELVLARRTCITWMTLALTGSICLGALAAAIPTISAQIHNDNLFFLLANQYFHPFISAWLLTSAVSAVMSSASAQLLLSSSALMDNLFPAKKGHSERYKITRSRFGIILIGIIALFLARESKASFFQFVGVAWAGLGASFGPLMLYSLYVKNVNTKAVVIGMSVGACLVAIGEYDLFTKTKSDWVTGYTCFPAFLVSLTTMLVLTYFFKKRESIGRSS